MRIPLEHWGATAVEVASAMPGDDLIDDAPMSATRSVDLDAPPEAVFGWLTQMGFGRAGWYSYDLIDNLGRRSARRIRPEWQVNAAGETVPGGPVDFTAAVVDPPHAFVIALLGQRLAGHRIDFTLAYRLDPRPGTQVQGTHHQGSHHPGTRLVSRARARVDGPLGRVVTPLLCLGDGVMVRRQLLGLRDRCRA